MGAGGEDVQLSAAARELFNFNIECKNRAAIAVFKDYAQAKTHGKSEPLVVLKQNQSKPLVLVDAEFFIDIIAKNQELTNQVAALLLVKGRR